MNLNNLNVLSIVTLKGPPNKHAYGQNQMRLILELNDIKEFEGKSVLLFLQDRERLIGIKCTASKKEVEEELYRKLIRYEKLI